METQTGTPLDGSWMAGAVVVATGGGSGIGRAVCTQFAAGGATVIIADRDRERLDDTVSAITASGGDAVGVPTDISSVSDVDRAIGSTLDRTGRIDVLVNNAGIIDRMSLVHETTDDEWAMVMAVNLTGTFNVTRRALPALLESRGAIVNVASVSGLRGGRAGTSYTVSKHGLVGLTLNTASTYADRGLRCNAVCPGPVYTNIKSSQTSFSEEGRQHLAPLLGTAIRFGEPDEIAGAVTFLASPHASFINGAIVTVDGGWLAA